MFLRAKREMRPQMSRLSGGGDGNAAVWRQRNRIRCSGPQINSHCLGNLASQTTLIQVIYVKKHGRTDGTCSGSLTIVIVLVSQRFVTAGIFKSGYFWTDKTSDPFYSRSWTEFNHLLSFVSWLNSFFYALAHWECVISWDVKSIQPDEELYFPLSCVRT